MGQSVYRAISVALLAERSSYSTLESISMSGTIQTHQKHLSIPDPWISNQDKTECSNDWQ